MKITAPDKEFFHFARSSTRIKPIIIDGKKILRFFDEYWTSKQRQANSLHEISYRACFKPQCPRFFIERFTKKGETVYDPFSGRGTTVIEAALLGRNIISNDINPISAIFSFPRLHVPTLKSIEKRLSLIPTSSQNADMDLSMFYHPDTESEIVSLKKYLQRRKESGKEDTIDAWIRMVATNRLTGHSSGFFSVYTLPPNQSVSQESQRKINKKLNQRPTYRNTREIILKKSLSLVSELDAPERNRLSKIGKCAQFFSEDARATKKIQNRTVKLTVTSPPFLNIVQYAEDHWLRSWFNGIDPKKIEKKISTPKRLDEWTRIMGNVFIELHRITQKDGWVAFEVGEIQNGKIELDREVVPLGLRAGFKCEGILVNKQSFTKTANIWGVRNNEKGTNTNRVVIFHKG